MITQKERATLISNRVLKELATERFRNEYKRSRVRTRLAYQIKALRKGREWVQAKLAEVLKKPQSAISRYEDEDYGKLTLETLFEISDAFDVGLLVEFVDYAEFMVRTSDLNENRLYRAPFTPASISFLLTKAPARPWVKVAPKGELSLSSGSSTMNMSIFSGAIASTTPPLALCGQQYASVIVDPQPQNKVMINAQ